MPTSALGARLVGTAQLCISSGSQTRCAFACVFGPSLICRPRSPRVGGGVPTPWAFPFRHVRAVVDASPYAAHRVTVGYGVLPHFAAFRNFQLSIFNFQLNCNCRLRDFQGKLVVCNRLFGYDQAIKSPDPSYGVTAKCFHCRDEHCSSALAKQAIVRQGDPIAFHVGTGLDLPPANCIRSECRTGNACPYVKF